MTEGVLPSKTPAVCNSNFGCCDIGGGKCVYRVTKDDVK